MSLALRKDNMNLFHCSLDSVLSTKSAVKSGTKLLSPARTYTFPVQLPRNTEKIDISWVLFLSSVL